MRHLQTQMCETSHMRTNASGARMNKVGDFLAEKSRRRQLGQQLARARRMAKLKQDDVSACLRLGGRENVSKIENGKRPVDWLELEALAALYGLTTTDFSTWSAEAARQLRYSIDEVERRARMPVKGQSRRPMR